jgi:hypothetical protein
VMTDRGLRLRLSQAAGELAKQFEWDAIARRHLEVYSRLL